MVGLIDNKSYIKERDSNMRTLKITIIGAGSTYTPELIEGFIQNRKTLNIEQICLMDIDEYKLKIISHLSERMLKAENMPCKLTHTTDLETALDNADFVLTQIRVGKLPARIIDEKIPLKYNMIGQETTGIGGFFKALRTIPVILDIAHKMEKLCPNAFLINFTNPAGIVTQALNDYSKIKSIGLCNVPINMISKVNDLIGHDNSTIEYVGLNHLSWITKVIENNENQILKLIECTYEKNLKDNNGKTAFSQQCMIAAGGIPSYYLEYFYNKNFKLKELLESEKSRGEQCIEIETELLEIYKQPTLETKPKQLEQRGGAKYSLAAVGLIDAIVNDRQQIHVVNTVNNNTLKFMKKSDIIEVPCIIGKDGASPIQIENFDNQHIIDLMCMLKQYERCTVEAAVSGNIENVHGAIMANPLMDDFETSIKCFEELKQAHKQYLPQFFRR